MDEIDARLLNLLQVEMPLTATPFEDLGASVGIPGDEVTQRLHALKDRKILRQISAIFDTRRLGYQSSLVAMEVEPHRVHEAAQVINQHPGVSHNYQRNHRFNLWFTVAVSPSCSLETTVDALHRLAGARSTRILQTLRMFKIGVRLDMTGEEDITGNDYSGFGAAHLQRHIDRELTPQDVAVIRVLQEDMALIPRPFAAMAEPLGMSEEELLAYAARLREEGFMRRFAAVLYHRRAGFRANAMGVWKVPEDRVEEVGSCMATFKAVSHCYQRPVYPDWPYNIFSMVHGRTDEDCEKALAAISQATRVPEYTSLYSTREYKKIRLRFFTEAESEWNRKYLALATVE